MLPFIVRGLPALPICAALALAACKRDAPEAPPPPSQPAPSATQAQASAAEVGDGSATSSQPDADRNPVTLSFQDVQRPYGDIPMLGLDGTEKKLSEVATAKVVFVVPWASITGQGNLAFAQQVQEMLADEPDAQVLVFSLDRAVHAEDREVLRSLVEAEGVTVPVWTDRTLKLVSVVHHLYPESRRGTNAVWTAPITAFSQGFEHAEQSHWDTDDLPALKAQLKAQVKRLSAGGATR